MERRLLKGLSVNAQNQNGDRGCKLCVDKCRLIAYMPTMTRPTPTFDLSKIRDWRVTAHSMVASTWRLNQAPPILDYGLHLVLGSKRNRLLCEAKQPTLRISHDTLRALAEQQDARIFVQGSLQYDAAFKPLRDAFLDEFQFAISTSIGAIPGRHDRTAAYDVARAVLSRRSVGRVLNELLEIFRRELAEPAPGPVVWWFRTRVRDVIATTPLKVGFRMRVHATPPAKLTTLREWARFFVIHTGFSPPLAQIADNDALHGGDNDFNVRPYFEPNPRLRWASGYPCQARFSRVLASKPAASGPELVYDWRLYPCTSTARWPLRRSDRPSLGNQLRVGLRRQPSLRPLPAAICG